MRMRYERRDPRPEDLRQIDELKSVVDSQEKDIFYLTEQLREMQLQLQQQQQQMPNHLNQQNANQSKRNKNKHNKNTASNRNGLINNGNSNNKEQHEASEPQETKQNANHEQPRMKPPPLIKTIIYEEENENELYEEQIREERENAKKTQDEEFEAELQCQQNGVVEHVPESPDYTTKNKHLEEFSEAHIVADHINIPDVVVIPHSPTFDDKLQEMRIEVITTIEPAHIQIVSGGNGLLDLGLD